MKLDSVVGGEDALLYMERYVDEGTRTYSPYAARSEAGLPYQPRSRVASFELVTVRVPHQHVSIVCAEPSGDLLERYVAAEDVLFVIHPEIWASPGTGRMGELRALPRGPAIDVGPTASTRTVLTRSASDARHHFLKVHYPRRISRFIRRLRRKNVHTSVEVTRDLASVKLETFAYLPDDLGIVYGDQTNAWGFLVREAKPRPRREDRFLIPFFSLYGGDLERPDDPPLLVQLIERSGADPPTFVTNEIVIPLVEGWAKVARERGILLESHAQNVLLEIDRAFRPRRIVHRDFDVWIDAEAREREGLEPVSSGAAIGRDTAYGRAAHYSLVYDHFLGRELLDYLLAILVRFYGVREEDVRRRVVETFHRSFPNAEAVFPRGATYYFSDEILPGNEFRLESTGRPPAWR